MKIKIILLLIIFSSSFYINAQDFDYNKLLGKWKRDHQFSYTQNQLRGELIDIRKVVLWDFISLSEDTKSGKVASETENSKNTGKVFEFELDTAANRVLINNGVYDMIYIVSKLNDKELHFMEIQAKVAGNRQLVPSGNLQILHYIRKP